MNYSFNIGDKVIYMPTNETVKIVNIDLSHNHIEVEFEDGAEVVVELKTLKREVDFELNVSEDLLKVFFSHYDNKDGTYTVPRQLLLNLLEKLI